LRGSLFYGGEKSLSFLPFRAVYFAKKRDWILTFTNFSAFLSGDIYRVRSILYAAKTPASFGAFLPTGAPSLDNA
jgi:hypothetical protein